MLKINKKVEYALMALKFMADKKDPNAKVSAREICDEFGAPFDTTAKVMQVLNNHGILRSVKGIKGGYLLNKELRDITYLELLAMIEGPESFKSVCSTHLGPCELFGKCNISTPLANLNRKFNNFLAELTLFDLLQGADFNHQTIKKEALL